METINKKDFTMDFEDYATIIFNLGILKGLRTNFESHSQRTEAENAILAIDETLEKYIGGYLGESHQLKTEVNEGDEVENEVK